MSVWFDELLNLAVKKAGGQRSLADAIKVAPGAINHWINSGTNPKINNLEAILDYLGGDIYRAFPDYEPEGEGCHMVIEGSVTANSERWSTDNYKTTEPHNGIFKRSRLWQHTHGQIIYLNVDGDSMEPEYPNRSIIACRQPATPIDRLPDNIPAILLVDGENNFKSFSYDPKTRMAILNPLNRDHRITVHPLATVRIQYLVVGMITPKLPMTNGTLLRDDEKPEKTPLPIIEV